MYQLKRYGLPSLYWRAMLKGTGIGVPQIQLHSCIVGREPTGRPEPQISTPEGPR